MTLRDPHQVAKRAIILTTLAFRGSLETIRQVQAVELSVQLPPWLRQIGVDDELDPIERKELETSLGRLSESQRIDARVAGDAAIFFLWTLNRGERPERFQWADAMPLITRLALQRDEVLAWLKGPTLRDLTEIEDAARETAAVLTALRVARLDHEPAGFAQAAKDVVVREKRAQWAALGVSLTDDDLQRATESVEPLTPDQRQLVAGMYFVRELAASWLFDRRPTYFHQNASTAPGNASDV